MSAENFTATIGLEIHAQLKTRTKLFSSSPNNTDIDVPNSIVSPIDVAHPGTLPALNYEAVKKVVQVGLAIGANIAEFTQWDRKNYFYPDIPKGYQISQYKYPLVTGGSIIGFDITRIHLEEDTGKSIHDQGDYSLVDFNRAGMPLMELVTEPVLHSGSDAVHFAKELQLILRYLGAGDANLEKGEMRIEANISVSNSNQLGTKVEVKNLNSFKSVERAIDYEIDRHIKANQAGEVIVQETRGWDEDKQVTFSQRAKEDAHDYRYFPDPDIPKLYVSEVFDLVALADALPAMPQDRRAKLQELDISGQQLEIFVSDDSLYDLFTETNELLDHSKVTPAKVANFITTNYLGAISDLVDQKPLTSIELKEVLELLADQSISSTGADQLLREIIQRSGESVVQIVGRLNIRQNNNREAIEELANRLIADFPDQVAEYQSGNENILKFLMGQGMKRSGGSVNPQVLTEVIQTALRN